LLVKSFPFPTKSNGPSGDFEVATPIAPVSGFPHCARAK